MNNKIISQFFFLVVPFFAVWFLLRQVDFVNEDDLRKFAKENEKKLGKLILETITSTNEKVENEKLHAVIDSIKVRICRTKVVNCDDIKIHIIRNSDINAFALPDNHMVIYTGLLDQAQNAEEVAGVMAHEIGHMEKNHVMKKLVKEIGMTMLFTIAGGDAGFEIARETAKILSSTAFDRQQERDADDFAVTSMAAADIDPQHLSNFFFRLSRKNNVPEELAWISTHPGTQERASEIIKKKKELSFKKEPILKMSWSSVKSLVTDDEPDITEEGSN
ncbi:MAG: M48 family metallopeptidase [Bacteroidota bacterium]